MQGLSETLFERLQGMYGDDISEMLTVQYRMHADIMQWSSDELYGGRLTAHNSVMQHTLMDLKVRHDLNWQLRICQMRCRVIRIYCGKLIPSKGCTHQ